jgi:biopolymer transport protein ExbB/TolQ
MRLMMMMMMMMMIIMIIIIIIIIVIIIIIILQLVKVSDITNKEKYGIKAKNRQDLENNADTNRPK